VVHCSENIENIKNKTKNIKNKTSEYALLEYRVQFGVNFYEFGSADFAENRVLFLKFKFNFQKGGQI